MDPYYIGAGRGCGASAGCLIVIAAFKAPAELPVSTMSGQPVEQRSRHLGLCEDAVASTEVRLWSQLNWANGR
jgi:hypothetical protein